ncbi:MAG TPA: hypothetical protein DFR83_19355 [Deltaproteobacteria bacterium]|nr:hypothetical protein [Deltaproteobacteria bacterium]
MAVQAQRQKRTIQLKDLDARWDSLYRFNAVRGTIITTSCFSKGTKEAAFAGSTVPITLIDGDKLIGLLIEHGIGVRKKTLEILEVEPEDFGAILEDGGCKIQRRLNPRPSRKLLTALSVLTRERDPKLTWIALLAFEPGLGCSLACADGASTNTDRSPESLVANGLTDAL